MGAVSRDFVIFDDNGQIVFTTNPDARVDMGKRDQGTYSDGEHVLSFVEFDLSNWCGVVVTPSEMFYKRLSVARTLYGLSVILSIVFGGICAWYMLKQNYKPVQSIIDLLEKKKRKAIQDGNEYAFLLETLSDMLENERATDKLLDKQSENLRRNFFIGLLYGNRDIKISEEIVGSIDFLSDNFIVLIFNAVNFTELFPEEKKMQEEQRKETAQFIITNIMTELIGKYHRCYMVEVGDELVGIVSLSPQRDEPERDVLEALNVGCSAIEDNFSLIMNVIVGALCENIEEISESYKEVFKALEYVRLTGQGGILRAREILENEEDDYSAYPPELDVRLANAIKSGKKDTATEVLEEIFNESVNSNRVIGRKERYLILEVVSTLLKVAGDETERKSLADICYMQDKTTVLKQELISVIDKLCDKNLIQIQEMSSGIELKVCDYIDEHYQEQTLTIQELGERFGLAPYYLSRNFKSKIGIGVAEYLRKIRVHKAQEIMSENEFIRLEEVAETVGLNGTRALTRAFKQELGILPTDFRASLIREK